MLDKSIKCLIVIMLFISSYPVVAKDINLTFRFNDPEHKEMRMALDEFESSNPGIQVKLERIAWKSSRDQLLREGAIGQGPDVVHSAFVWVEEFAQSGALLPIEDLVKYSPLENGFEDFVATDLTYHDGKAYGIPWTADTWSMVYNNNVLNEAGITSKPNTWEEVLAVSRAINQKTGKYGVVQNKHARHNLCFSKIAQEAKIEEGKGTRQEEDLELSVYHSGFSPPPDFSLANPNPASFLRSSKDPFAKGSRLFGSTPLIPL